MSKKQAPKPVVGFYDLTGCQGCQLSVLFNEEEVLDLISHIDIKAFRFIKGQTAVKRFDVILVEGLVASNNDLEVLKELRKKTDVLVALGSCACTGCIPAYRNFMDQSKYSPLVYHKDADIKDQPATSIDEHVNVDFFIPGCPPDQRHIANFLKDLLLGKRHPDYDKPVCFECRLNENECLLDRNKMCFGPITRGGCNSICTNGGLECWGCRGPTPDANIKLMIDLLEEKGFTKDHIKQRLHTFAGLKIARPSTKLSTFNHPKPKKKDAKYCPFIREDKISAESLPTPSEKTSKKTVTKSIIRKKETKLKAHKSSPVKKGIVKKKSMKKQSIKKKTVKKTSAKSAVSKTKMIKKKSSDRSQAKNKTVKKKSSRKIPGKKNSCKNTSGKKRSAKKKSANKKTGKDASVKKSAVKTGSGRKKPAKRGALMGVLNKLKKK